MKSQVTIRTFQREGITLLKEDYTTNPFKVMDIREDKQEACLALMIMSSSPGVLDGDQYFFDIEVDKNCALALSTQSYQRIFNMKGSAKQECEVKIAEGAYFQYAPHPTVPHKNAHFSTFNNIHLSKNASLIWSDLFSCGRKLNGESFDYHHFENRTTIYQDGLPKVIEHLRFQPANKLPNGMGHLEGFSHSGSIFVIDAYLNSSDLKVKVDTHLSAFSEIEFGTSAAPINGLVIKLLANSGEYLHDINQDLIELLKHEIGR